MKEDEKDDEMFQINPIYHHHQIEEEEEEEILLLQEEEEDEEEIEESYHQKRNIKIESNMTTTTLSPLQSPTSRLKHKLKQDQKKKKRMKKTTNQPPSSKSNKKKGKQQGNEIKDDKKLTISSYTTLESLTQQKEEEEEEENDKGDISSHSTTKSQDQNKNLQERKKRRMEEEELEKWKEISTCERDWLFCEERNDDLKAWFLIIKAPIEWILSKILPSPPVFLTARNRRRGGVGVVGRNLSYQDDIGSSDEEDEEEKTILDREDQQTKSKFDLSKLTSFSSSSSHQNPYQHMKIGSSPSFLSSSSSSKNSMMDGYESLSYDKNQSIPSINILFILLICSSGILLLSCLYFIFLSFS